MVPTTDACKSLNDGIDLPDHGEVWARSWNVDQVTSDSALLSIKLNTRTLDLTRRITLIEISDNAYEIKLQYSLQNYGDSQIPAFWSSHPLFRAEGVKEIVIANRNAATLTDGFDLTFSSFVVSKIVVQANG